MDKKKASGTSLNEDSDEETSKLLSDAAKKLTLYLKQVAREQGSAAGTPKGQIPEVESSTSKGNQPEAGTSKGKGPRVTNKIGMEREQGQTGTVTLKVNVQVAEKTRGMGAIPKTYSGKRLEERRVPNLEWHTPALKKTQSPREQESEARTSRDRLSREKFSTARMCKGRGSVTRTTPGKQLDKNVPKNTAGVKKVGMSGMQGFGIGTSKGKEPKADSPNDKKVVSGTTSGKLSEDLVPYTPGLKKLGIATEKRSEARSSKGKGPAPGTTKGQQPGAGKSANKQHSSGVVTKIGKEPGSGATTSKDKAPEANTSEEEEKEAGTPESQEFEPGSSSRKL